ncbi:hypothetical protein [Methanobrevibacter smithii]|uniref:hypothetical protein n=1 Tax=Methanobrevibacter smithii TaxID=2173 RepID=UPI0037DC60E4
MKKNLDEINKDILEKIDSLEIEDNIKDFLKEALYEEYTHRDENYTLSNRRSDNYGPLIDKYYDDD